MKEGVFISYRREDCSTFASVLYFELTKFFLAKNIFKDIDTLKPGSDFKKDIKEAIAGSFIQLVLINKNWVRHKKLFSDSDFVRFEIETAFENEVDVIPILLDKGKMPSQKDLPESLWPLCEKQCFEIRPESVMQNIDALIEVIRSKRKFKFEDGTITGEYERLFKDPVNSLKTHWKKGMETWKKDFFNIKGLLSRKKNKDE